MKHVRWILLHCATCILAPTVVKCDDESKDSDELTDFKNMFLQKRLLQLNAVKRLVEMEPEKRASFLSSISKKVFQMLSQKRTLLESSGFVPGTGIPADRLAREAMAMTLENVCLASDLLLRMPDAVHKLLDQHKDWAIVYKWSIGFAQETKMLDESTSKLLSLASQEVGLVEKQEDYHNPYKIVKKTQKRFEDPPEPKKRERKKIKKGPRMHQEL